MLPPVALLLPPFLQDYRILFDFIPAPELAAALPVEEDRLEDVVLDIRFVTLVPVRLPHGSMTGFSSELLDM